MVSRWYRQACHALDVALSALPPDATEEQAVRACRAAYPYGVRRHYPYRQWLKAQREVLAMRFPNRRYGIAFDQGSLFERAER